MNKFLSKFESKSYRWWFILLVVSTIGVITMFLSTFVFQDFLRGNETRKVNGVNVIVDDKWKEYLILFLYFTFMSNVFGIVTSAIVVFGLVDQNSKHLQRTKVMMAVNLTVASVIFWTVLVGKLVNYSPFSIVSTVMVHAVTPILAVFVFFYESVVNKKTKVKLDPVNTSMINLIFPVLWVIMAVTLYVSISASEDWNDITRPDNAIYGFLDFLNGWLMPTIVITSISIMYPLLTWGYTKLYNK